ncbi:MAG TPA: sugar kinase [Streptosporangiaceae bacterium]|nr:sugar kinase [Streptosporangiaceae bacterium]
MKYLPGEEFPPEAPAGRFDVVVLGEVLVEFHADATLGRSRAVTLSFSGDALNAAAAAAAAGARTALLTAVGDDDLGEAILTDAVKLGVDVSLVRRDARPNGAYLLTPDVSGHREFIYWRTGSAGSTLSPVDVDAARAVLTTAGCLVTSGITGALSSTAREAVGAAARLVRESGGAVVYDPNFRRRLTGAGTARALLAEVAPLATLITPSCPGDTSALLGTDDPGEAAERCRSLGAGWVAVTAGAHPVVVQRGARRWRIPVPPNPDAVDATGAGDVLVGTTAARLALGQDPDRALETGVAAASLSVAGTGGTGYLPGLEESLALVSGGPRPARSAEGRGEAAGQPTRGGKR